MSSSSHAHQPPETLKRRREGDTGTEGVDSSPEQTIRKFRKISLNSTLSQPKDSAASRLPPDVWKLVLEHCTPSGLRKARLLSKEFRLLIDDYQSILVNCRFQTYGLNLLSLPEELSERQFNILLEGKGCKICGNPRVTKTYWSWCERLCVECWRKKTITESGARKSLKEKKILQVDIRRILNSLPWGMMDSYRNPHHLLEKMRIGKVALQKVFQVKQLNELTSEYQEMIPVTTDPDYREKRRQLPNKLNTFFDERIDKNNKRMDKAIAIETAVRGRATKAKEIKKKNKESRKELFMARAVQELPEIPVGFTTDSNSFQAATKIDRDGGSERSWMTLKKKLMAEWNVACETSEADTTRI